MDNLFLPCWVDYTKNQYKWNEPFFIVEVIQRLYSEPNFKEDEYPIIAIRCRLLMKYILKGDLNDKYTVLKIIKLQERLLDDLTHTRFLKFNKKYHIYKYDFNNAYNHYKKYVEFRYGNKNC